ncbi:MAG: glycerol-3-phosphate dehydrogenase [Xanthobacteraceae bacterium]|nr:MAG: glycerol-3-phosphate dehydrogenase [Xanthobacteraceae bacterium]
MAEFDLAIIGGGINGAGLARDAAGRGLSVLLMEQNDLASGTSSKSTKLIHGGLRYLEHGAFRLVREALREREVLWRMAPHIVRPLRFVLPTDPEGRPALLLRLGLFLYDHLGGRKLLPPTAILDLTHHPLGVPLKRPFGMAFEYSDCQVDDARLVVLNAMDAAARGAVVRVGARCVRADRDRLWSLMLNDRGHRATHTARVLVNAAGPWVNTTAQTVLRAPARPARLVKGSHIVVRRMFDTADAYIFQNRDGRVVFAIPFARDFTLIGTTDEDFRGDLAILTPSAAEVAYLCEAVNHYFRAPVASADVVHAFSGVRALYDDGSKAAQDTTREYVLKLDRPRRLAPLLTIYGGKITTYRRLAEAALRRLAPVLPMAGPWTEGTPLPGGDFPCDGADELVRQTRTRWPFLSEPHAWRLVDAYGTRVAAVLGEARTLDDLGPCFGADLTAAEVRYLMAHEWARTEDDVLWRRSKLGLVVNANERAALAAFMARATAA